MIIVFWIAALLLSFVPGVLIGVLIGRYWPSRLTCLFLAGAAGTGISLTAYPDLPPTDHLSNQVGFLPPFLLVLLLGHALGRWRRRRELKRAAGPA